MNKVRIKPFFRGLGDHLQFSTLPEVLNSRGVSVDLHSDAEFSNGEIEDLVYGCNPFIQGKSHGSWDYGDGSSNWNYRHLHKSFIRNIESASGLPDQNDFPKIYYEPKKVGSYDVIIDLSSVCLRDKLDYEKSAGVIRQVLDQEIPGGKPQIVRSKYFDPNNFLGLPEINVSSLKQYVDVIYSSIFYISFLSGGHSLASSIRHLHPDLVQYCVIPEHLPNLGRGDSEGLSFYDYHIEKGFWTFPKVKYKKY